MANGEAPELAGRVLRVDRGRRHDTVEGSDYYEAVFAPDHGEAERVGQDLLISGLPSELIILGENRTPASYLIEPVMRSIRRAFREG